MKIRKRSPLFILKNTQRFCAKNLSQHSIAKREWIDISKWTKCGDCVFMCGIYNVDVYMFVLMCRAALTDDENHTVTTTDPHSAYFFLNTQCVILSRCSICPWFPLPRMPLRDFITWPIPRSLISQMNVLNVFWRVKINSVKILRSSIYKSSLYLCTSRGIPTYK